MIKPILTAGDLRVIGSTTFEDYKHIEKDRALARRLQRITIDEPSVQETVKILAGLRGRYEAHHGVTFTDEALEAAAKLAGRHLRDYKLPDSAIDVMDEAGAVSRLRGSTGTKAEITAAEIEAVVARIARIPARQASASDRERLRTLEESLQRLVFGQDAAVRMVAQSIKRSRAGLGMPDRPAGAFLFTGPTGVGKTELAKQLAIQLGNEFIRFDMSEYMEKHAVARLIGAPPGYVGFEQGGQLVDAVRTHPYSVVLLDEIEKAHPDIYNILLQVMDHATLTDNTGRKADFRNVVLILTSNAGSREMSAKSIGFSDAAIGQNIDAALQRVAASRQMAAVERVFSPEFRNRLDAIVTFNSLSMDVMETIVEKFILQLEAQLAERRVAITLTPDARTWLAGTGYDPIYGARPLARVIQREVRDRLTDEILFGQLENGGTVTIGAGESGLTFSFEPPKNPTQEPKDPA
jgi:ATP-dependent Clp protease ATP-binding subunit ClpA